MTLLEGTEWFTLTNYYAYDVEIMVMRSSETGALVYSPGVCETCLEQSKLDQFIFECKKIYVRTVEETDAAPITSSNGSGPDGAVVLIDEEQSESAKRSIHFLDDDSLYEDEVVPVNRETKDLTFYK